MNGADSVYRALKTLGVEHVFGIVSIHNMAIFDAINRHGDISIIDCRHEQAATHAADGYARAGNRLGVVIASTGPGTTNTVTGLYEASYSSSPVLLITGQAETLFLGKGQGYVHEAEKQKIMLETVTRRSETIRTSEQIFDTLIAVAKDMLSGKPQPAAVEIPVDLQYQTVKDAEEQTPSASFTAPAYGYVTPELLDAAAKLISQSSKRVILAGGGAAHGGDVLQKFAEQLNAPVFTTANGRGSLPEDHPLAMGNLFQSRKIHADLAEAELTIAIGTRFQVGVGGMGAKMTPPGKLLHINLDARALNLVHQSDIAINGDATQTIESLMTRLNPEAGDEDFLKKVKIASDGVKSGLRRRIGKDYESIMDIMREQLPRDAMIVRDTTVPAYNFGNQLLEIYHPESFIGPGSGAIGPGLPLAIGAALGSKKKTMVIHGDGGFMFHATELATAAQYQLPIIVALFNDGGYGVLRGLQTRQFDGRMADVNLGFVDFVKMAESMGVDGMSIKSVEDFKQGFKLACAASGPFLLDIDMRCFEPMQGSILP